MAGTLFRPREPNSLLRIIPVAMTDTDADRCRKEAEECRKQAERSVPLARYGDLVADYRPRRPTGEELDTLVAHMFSAILSETRPSRTYADVSAVFARSKLCQGEPRWRRFWARSAERDADTDRARIGSIVTAIENACTRRRASTSA